MILAYDDLVAAWKAGEIGFTPNIAQQQIGESSIDLRLGTMFTWLKEAPGVTVRPAQGYDPTPHVEHQDFSTMPILGQTPVFKIKPGQFFLGFTLEKLKVPGNLAANVQGKSSLARAGLSVHNTAPNIHPGFSGPIVLELFNNGPWELELQPGEDLVCQVSFMEVKTPVPQAVTDTLGTYLDQATPFPKREEKR
jgi:dCTP deaminase